MRPAPSGAFAAAVAAFLFPTGAAAHMRLIDPPPVNEDLTNGSSCGTVQGTPTRTQLVAGTVVDVHWIEVQEHAGTFRLSFAQDGRTDFTTLVDDIPHPNSDPLPRMFSQTITVPNIPCTNCTLQFGLNENGGLNYVSCADIEIVAPPPMDPPDAGVPDVGVAPDSGGEEMGSAAAVDAGTDRASDPAQPSMTSTPPPAVTPSPTAPESGPPSTPSAEPMASTPNGSSSDPAEDPRAGASADGLRRMNGRSPVHGGCACVGRDRPVGSAFALLLSLAATAWIALTPRAKSSRRARPRGTRQPR
jgi:hypothetical protein